MKRLLREYWPIGLLFLISLILCLQNYTPGTILSGWDTLHPEFNFGLNIERAISGVFRPEQGLGAVAAHSQMADLPRIFSLFLAHFILPLSFLRYSYIFLTLVIGPLGMYLLLKNLILKEKKAAFLGALFYLLNLATIQTFNVPFEMFTTLFATLPLIFYFASKYLMEKEKKNRNLLFFAIVILFNAPSAYASTLWYVFFGCFFVYFLLFSLINKAVKRFTLLLITILLINSFWILPNIYFVVNHGIEVQNANINILFSDQAFLKNKEFGNPSDILLLKSFYFDWNIYQGNGNFGDLLLPFITHLKTTPNYVLGYFYGFLFILGLVYMVKSKRKNSTPLLALLLICLFFLINDNPPFSLGFKFLQNNFPLFKEAFRFPDDKILNIFAFSVSILFGFSMLLLNNILQKINKQAGFVLLILIFASLIFYTLPAFSGNLINKYLRINIPQSYFDLFSYLDKQKGTGKVANLPINSQWGWVYYDWQAQKPGFQGAGFLYFGIRQPLLDRDFDRWSPYNESYYREMSYSVYKEDAKLLTNTLKKYDIAYVFLDKNVIDPEHQKTILYQNQIQTLLQRTNLIEERKTFGNTILYKIKKSSEKTKLPLYNVTPQTRTIYADFAYNLFGDYVTDLSKDEAVVYPFRDLINNQSKVNSAILKIDSNTIKITPEKTGLKYLVNGLDNSETIIPANLLINKTAGSLLASVYPQTPVFDSNYSSLPLKVSFTLPGALKNLILAVNNNELFNLTSIPDNTPLAVGKINLKNSDNTFSFYDAAQFKPVENIFAKINPYFSTCDNLNPKNPSITINSNNISLSSKGKSCILLPLSFLLNEKIQNSQEVLVKLQFEYQGNKKLSSCLYNRVNSSCLNYQTWEIKNNLYSSTYSLTLSKINDFALMLYLDSDTQGFSKLNNISFSFTSPLQNFVVAQNFVSNLFAKSESLSFKTMTIIKNTLQDNPDVTKNNKLTNDCGQKGESVRKSIVSLNGKEIIKYDSSLGSFCDHFSYNNLSHSQGYLIEIESKNEKGLPLTVCISNYTSKKCDIYVDLPQNKEFKKDVYLLPSLDTNGLGYDINLENLGIKGSEAVNFLSSIQVTPVPFDLIQEIHSLPALSLLNSKEEMIKIDQLNPFAYYKLQSGNYILNLQSSFEKGFKVYEITCTNKFTCLLKTTFAPVFGKEIKNHLLVNNWSNGWEINTNKSLTVAVIFLPQYLEYLGFILLFLVFISLIIKR